MLINLSIISQFDYHISKLDDSYDKRIKRLRHFCNKYNLTNKITTFWRKNSNQGKFGKKKYCTTKSCPLIVNEEHKLLWCFVQKVASTSLKKLFTNLLSKTDTNQGNQYENITAFHLEANNLLYRVSPMYYNQHQLNGLFKFIFVRHPFKRIVSAFEDKGNKSRSEEPYFYAKYWDKIMKKQRGETNVNENSRPTFEEFINYLIETHPFLYDEHWAPYWTRCEPCLIKYDFIGKLETSKQDLEFLLAKCKQNKCKQNLDNRIWENKNNITKTNNKIKYYFIKLTPEKITQLYKIYFLDFKLFGYTIEEIFH